MSGPRRSLALILSIAALLATARGAFAAPGAWDAERRLTSGSGHAYTSYNFARSVAAEPDGRVQVVWYDDRGGSFQIYTPAWVAHGGDPADLTAALQGFEQHLDQALQDWEIYTRRSDDGGRTWGPALRLTYAPGLSQRPSLVADGNRVDVLWFDGRDGNLEIYAKESIDRGGTWSADQRLTQAPGDSQHVSLATAGGDLYAVWYDERDGNPEIYFRHRPR